MYISFLAKLYAKGMLEPCKCMSAGCETRTCGKEILSLYLKAMLSNYRPGDISKKARDGTVLCVKTINAVMQVSNCRKSERPYVI